MVPSVTHLRCRVSCLWRGVVWCVAFPLQAKLGSDMYDEEEALAINDRMIDEEELMTAITDAVGFLVKQHKSAALRLMEKHVFPVCVVILLCVRFCVLPRLVRLCCSLPAAGEHHHTTTAVVHPAVCTIVTIALQVQQVVGRPAVPAVVAAQRNLLLR